MTGPSPDRGKLTKALAVARSSLRRYPAQLAASLGRAGGHLTEAVDEAARRLVRATMPQGDTMAASWLGHATVLMRIGGLRVLTDPVLSHRIGPSLGRRTIGFQRLVDPPVIDDEHPVDVILISHAHYDHLDKPTLRRLVSEKTQVVTARATASLIPRGFGHVREIDWGEDFEIRGVNFRAIRPRHWGARNHWDRHRGYNSYLIDAGKTQSILFAGDTAYTEAFRDLNARLGIFGIGAYDPWVEAHATPEQVWRMFTDMGGQYLLPMHHSTFRLSDEHHEEPIARLMAAAGSDADRIIARELGQLWAEGAD